MFKRMTTSLTKPPLAVFFMKDSWGRVILYLFLISSLFLLPGLLEHLANPGMSVDRYQRMTTAIQQDLLGHDASIDGGSLTYLATSNTTFDYLTIYIGDQPLEPQTVGLVFSGETLSLYLSNVAIRTETLTSLGLSNFDFSIRNEENARILATTIRTFYEADLTFTFMDLSLSYLIGFFDYVFYVLLMTFVVVIFAPHIVLPMRLRVKLSIYLTSIYALSMMVLTLFNAIELDIIAVILTSIYHLWAYRSMRIIDKGVIQ